MSVEIERGIPIPKGGGRRPRFPELRTMEVGESFFVTEDFEMVRHAVNHMRRYWGLHFIVRKVVHNGTVGTRVWRDK